MMAGLKLQWHLTELRERERGKAALAHSAGAAVTFPLVETHIVQQCT